MDLSFCGPTRSSRPAGRRHAGSAAHALRAAPTRSPHAGPARTPGHGPRSPNPGPPHAHSRPRRSITGPIRRRSAADELKAAPTRSSNPRPAQVYTGPRRLERWTDQTRRDPGHAHAIVASTSAAHVHTATPARSVDWQDDGAWRPTGRRRLSWPPSDAGPPDMPCGSRPRDRRSRSAAGALHATPVGSRTQLSCTRSSTSPDARSSWPGRPG